MRADHPGRRRSGQSVIRRILSVVRTGVRTTWYDRTLMRTSFLCLRDDQAATLRGAQPSEEQLALAARRLGALADPTRLRVAVVLATASELCVGDTADLLDLPVKLVSHHVRTLAERGLATKHRDGKLVRYRLTDEARDLLASGLGQAVPVQVEVAHHHDARQAQP
jgi:ArsR family transcriptional regulator, lead/cadmium/zinc/bismuth-responsive transcriptional repressor